MGYIILFACLALNGLWFSAHAMGSGSPRSEEALGSFFLLTSGFSMFACALVSMRLVAEERQLGTLTLLATSPVRDSQFIIGKFLGGFIFVCIFIVLTAYMPILLFFYGKVSIAHILTGYLGVLLISGASIAIGTLCSALAPNQLLSFVLTGGVLVLFILLWLLSRIADPPLDDLIAYLSIHDKHFKPFGRGILSLRDVGFYLSLIYVALVAATKVLEARRWQ